MPDKRQGRTGQVTINGRSYFLFEEIGRGAASICYRAICDNKRYVVKEFFPAAIAVRGDDGNVIPSNEENADETFTKKKTEFIRSAKFHQNRLHDIQQNDFLSVIEYDEENGFVVMNDTDGQTLAAWAEKQTMNDEYVRKCIQIVKGIIDETEKYHKAGYVHLDLKAENVYKFNIENEQTLTRIFDFDSIQSIDSLYDSIQSKTAHIHTTNECYGKEIRDINSQKADYITKEMLVRLDYYAIIKILHFLLYGCYEKTVMDDKTPFEEYYAECTVLNNYLGNLFYGLLKPIDKRNYTAGDIKVYLDKLGFIIDNQRHWTVYSRENLRQNFKSSLMSDIKVGDTLYTMNKGISAVEQVAENYDGHLFLHGYDGGRGKTTAMQWLMFRMTGDLKPIYLYIELKKLAPNDDIEEQILAKYRLKRIPAHCTLLLDGYNEVNNVHVKEDLKRFINRALNNSRFRIIISGRKVEYSGCTTCCTLNGIQNRDKRFDYLSNELRSNPMIICLYSGIDMGNINDDVKKELIGVQDGVDIKISTKGEALWNYFQIQIDEKSIGYTSIESEYKKFIFETLPYIVNFKRYPNQEAMLLNLIINENGVILNTDDEKRFDRSAFERCNGVFNLCEVKSSIMGNCYMFVHEDYEDFFEALCILNEVDAFLNGKRDTFPAISPIAADIIGTHYCEPIVSEDKILVPKGHKQAYFGNGKEIVGVDKNIKNSLVIFKALEYVRENFKTNCFDVQRIMNAMPKKYMNFGGLNIGWLITHDYGLYDRLGIGEYRFDPDTNAFYGTGKSDAFVNPDTFIETFASEYCLVHYSDICFDGSYLKLQDNCSDYFENCSFNNMMNGSKLPYLLSKPPSSQTVRIGNCIYTKDKSVLLDYVSNDDEDDKIILFANTAKIDEAFSKHCKNPYAKIRNESNFFELSEKVLYGYDGATIEFCERDIENINIPKRPIDIKKYALSYCSKLTSVEEIVDMLNNREIYFIRDKERTLS